MAPLPSLDLWISEVITQDCSVSTRSLQTHQFGPLATKICSLGMIFLQHTAIKDIYLEMKG